MSERTQKRGSSRSTLTRTLIWDVAQEAEVSIATVSRALNGKADVAEATREKVLRVAQARGYISNQHARQLVGRRMIGFTIPYMSSLYSVEILHGAAEALEHYDSNLVVCPAPPEAAREKSLSKRLLQSELQGALLVLAAEGLAELRQLQQRSFPFVVIDPMFPMPESVLVVTATNITGARQATEHLLTLGHRRIGVISGPANWCATIERLAGYHSVLSGAGLTVDPSLTIAANFSLESGRQAAHALLNHPEPPTAIFAFNDDMAVGTLRAAAERGIRVPQDLSIVGFDDASFTTCTTPELTTVHQPLRELGQAGVALLFRQLQGQVIDARRIELSTQLVTRASTGPAPAPPN